MNEFGADEAGKLIVGLVTGTNGYDAPFERAAACLNIFAARATMTQPIANQIGNGMSERKFWSTD